MEGNRVKEIRRGQGVGRAVGIFALGAATGGIIALLFAPASGCVTRRRIALKVRAMRRQTIQQLSRTKRLLARKAEDLRETTTEKLHDARAWVAHRLVDGNGHREVRRRVAHHA